MADLQKYRASELERARTADLLRIVPKGRASVLDIGARDGHFSKLLTTYFPSVTALDLKKPSLDRPDIETVAGDVTNLNFPDRSFDCIFCTEVLEHVPEIVKACQEISRVARYEIVIGVPFEQDIRIGRTTCGACGKRNPPWGHVNSFNESRVSKLFPGWQVISTSFVGVTQEATNRLSVVLMDLAGNPWGTYDSDLGCLYCGTGLRPPAAKRTIGSRICSALAHRLNRIQLLWTRPHHNWIHVVLSRSPA